MESAVTFAPLRPAGLVNVTGRGGARQGLFFAGRASLVRCGPLVMDGRKYKIYVFANSCYCNCNIVHMLRSSFGLNINRYKTQLPLKDQIYNDFKGKSWVRVVTIVVISGVSMGGIG